MAERILPPPDAFATCPTDGKILEYYAGAFEAVFVLLHPFIKTVSIGIEQFVSATYPCRSKIVSHCVPVSWAEVASEAGLQSIAAVDIGLRTMIGGLKAEFSNQDYADKIESLGQSYQILPPPEGFFSDLLHDKILQAIQSLGYEWVWVGDEFDTERKLYWIEDLKRQDAEATARHHCNVFTPDKGLLWTTHWDSHFSFLALLGAVLLLSRRRTNLKASSAHHSRRSIGASGLSQTELRSARMLRSVVLPSNTARSAFANQDTAT